MKPTVNGIHLAPLWARLETETKRLWNAISRFEPEDVDLHGEPRATREEVLTLADDVIAMANAIKEAVR